MTRKIAIAIFLTVFGFSPIQAQNLLEQLNDTTMVSAEDAPTDAAPILAKKWNQLKTKHFTLNFGVAMFLDYNTVKQDDNNIQQVEKIGSATEFRAQRLIFSGTLLFFKRPWRYMVAANYNGMDAPQGKENLSVIDLNIEIPFGRSGWITLGKQKEGVGHEYIMPGSQGMFTERGSGAPAFVKQRNIGVRYSNSILKNRATYTDGVFNSWLEKGNENSFADNGMQYTARVTGLPMYTADDNFMHVGLGWRYTNAPGGKLSYKAKPEANTAPYFINTGSFDASAANTLMLEWIGVTGPFSVAAEYMNAFISSKSHSNPDFNYWQIGGSWFITGDHRNYNKQSGSMGKLFPKRISNLAKEAALAHLN